MTADLGPDRSDALPGAVPREPGTGRLLRRYLAVCVGEDMGVPRWVNVHMTGAVPPTFRDVQAAELKGARGLDVPSAWLVNIIELADPPASPEGTSP